MFFENVEAELSPHAGVLPVSVNSPDIPAHNTGVQHLESINSSETHQSALKQLLEKSGTSLMLTDVHKNSSHGGVEGLVDSSKNGKTIKDEVVLLSGSSSGTDFFDPNSPIIFGNFGGDYPSYGLPEIVITGPSSSSFPGSVSFFNVDHFWDFGGITISPLEYEYLHPEPGQVATHVQQVDWAFIEQLEGNTLYGTIPKKDGVILGQSGVTIAAGFDLGQHSSTDLGAMNFPAELNNKLTPYLGLKGLSAEAQLNNLPLNITNIEAAQINNAVHGIKLVNLVATYDTAVGAGAFYSLPPQAQTVIASVSFQYGNLAGKTPNFWSDVTHNDWAGAVNELRNFNDAYPTRRNTEANLLDQIVPH